MVRRHHLAGDAGGPDAVVQALVALHATDPASVYLSVLARSAATTLTDVAEAMYARRSLVRWMAMRRTLFVFAREDIPTIQAAVSTDVAATLRRRLISQLERNGSAPPVGRDIAGWLADLEVSVEDAVNERGAATGTELAADHAAVETRILARTALRHKNATASARQRAQLPRAVVVCLLGPASGVGALGLYQLDRDSGRRTGS